MKICEGKILELDPNKWYWLVINKYADIDFDQLANLSMENGNILLVDDMDSIEFIENPGRIKGIIIREFKEEENI